MTPSRRRTGMLLGLGTTAALLLTGFATYGWRVAEKTEVTLELNTPPATAGLNGTTFAIRGGNAGIVTGVSPAAPWSVKVKISTLARYRLRWSGIEHTLLISEHAVKEAVATAAGLPESAVVRLSGTTLFE